MIRAIIRFSANNRLLVLLATAVAVAYGVYTVQHIPVDAIPDLSRHAGHHLLALGPQPRHHRGPGHLSRSSPRSSARRTSRPSAASPTSASPTSTSSSRTARTSTGRAAACSSTCRKIQPRLPAGRADRARPRRDRRRLGLPVRAGRPTRASTRWPSCARFQDWNLRYALQSCPASPRSPPSAASSSSTRSPSIPTGSRPTASRSCEVVDAVRAQQQRGRRAPARVRAAREYMVRGRGYVKIHDDLEQIVAQDATRAARRCCCATSARVALGPGDPPRRRRPRRPGRRGRRHRGHAPRRERARRHRRASRQRLAGDRARRCRRACEVVTDLRPLGPDRARRSTRCKHELIDGDDHRLAS